MIETTDQLKSVLRRISFAKSCIDFDWNFEINEVFDSNHQWHAAVEKSLKAGASINEAFVAAAENKIIGWFVNTTFRRPDTHSGDIGKGRGRKEFIAVGTSDDSAIKTAWVLVKMIVEHELMEAFLVDSKRIFDPHSSIEALQYGKVECSEARTILA